MSFDNKTKIGKDKTVLIVDDMSTMRRLLSQPCRELGYKVEFAGNAKDAIEMIEYGQNSRENRIDLVLCDWHMPPGMDGVEILEELSEKGLLDETLFFMITAEDTINDIFRAAESILPGYLTKSKFSIKMLEQKILNATRNQQDKRTVEKILERDKIKVQEKDLKVKYQDTINICKTIFKKLRDEKLHRYQLVHKNRIAFLQRKLQETEKLAGSYRDAQKTQILEMLTIAKSNFQMNSTNLMIPSWPLRKVGEIFEDEGQFDTALRQYLSIIEKINPLSAWVHVDVGRVYMKKKEYDTAEKYFRKAIKLNPKFQKARDAISEYFALTGRQHEAIKVIDEAIALSPNKPSRIKFKGDVHIQLGTVDDAIQAEKCYLRVLDVEEKIPKKQVENNTNVGKSLLLQPTKVTMAKEYLDRAVKFSKEPKRYHTPPDECKNALLTRGDCFLKLGYDQKAVEDFKDAVRTADEDEGSLSTLQVSAEIGNVYFKNKKTKEAIEWMTNFISRDPKNEEKQKIFEKVLTENGKGGEVQDIINKALDSAFQHLAAVNKECKSLRKEGRFNEAVNEYTSLMNEHPSDEGLWFNKGRALYDYAMHMKGQGDDTFGGKLAEAKFHFKKAIELEEKQHHAGKGRIREALQTLNIDINLQKEDIEIGQGNGKKKSRMDV